MSEHDGALFLNPGSTLYIVHTLCSNALIEIKGGILGVGLYHSHVAG